MCWVVNKETLQYLTSRDTAKFLDGSWLINPTLPDCEQKYWKIWGDKVIEMNTEDKAVIAAAEAEQVKMGQKEMLIINKQQEISRAVAIQALKDEGVLDVSGDVVGG